MASDRCLESVAAELNRRTGGGWAPTRVLAARPAELMAAYESRTDNPRRPARRPHQRRRAMPRVDEPLVSRVLELINDGAHRPTTRAELLQKCPTDTDLRRWERGAAELQAERAAERAQRAREARLGALGGHPPRCHSERERARLAAISPTPGAGRRDNSILGLL